MWNHESKYKVWSESDEWFMRRRFLQVLSISVTYAKNSFLVLDVNTKFSVVYLKDIHDSDDKLMVQC